MRRRVVSSDDPISAHLDLLGCRREHDTVGRFPKNDSAEADGELTA